MGEPKSVWPSIFLLFGATGLFVVMVAFLSYADQLDQADENARWEADSKQLVEDAKKEILRLFKPEDKFVVRGRMWGNEAWGYVVSPKEFRTEWHAKKYANGKWDTLTVGFHFIYKDGKRVDEGELWTR